MQCPDCSKPIDVNAVKCRACGWLRDLTPSVQLSEDAKIVQRMRERYTRLDQISAESGYPSKDEVAARFRVLKAMVAKVSSRPGRGLSITNNASVPVNAGDAWEAA